MPSLQSLKARIGSVKSTQKITKAMQVVSTSKLKRARERSEAAVYYANKMNSLVATTASGIDDGFESVKLLKGNGCKTSLFIVVTADRGLCGAFNISVIKFTRKILNEMLKASKPFKVVCVGRRGYELLKKQYGSYIIEHSPGANNKGVQYSAACDIGHSALSLFHNGEIGECNIIYNKFKSVVSQIPTAEKLAPLLETKDDFETSGKPIPEFEPGKEEILNELLSKNIRVQIYRALLESFAGEHASRMVAMENATRNSGEIIKKLQVVYNRTRQAYITKELVEIISGAEAV